MIYKKFEQGGHAEFWGFEKGIEWDPMCPFPNKGSGIGCKFVPESELPFYWKGGVWLILPAVRGGLSKIEESEADFMYNGAKTADLILKLPPEQSPVAVYGFDIDGRQKRFLDKLRETELSGRSVLLVPRRGVPVPPVPSFVNIKVAAVPGSKGSKLSELYSGGNTYR